MHRSLWETVARRALGVALLVAGSAGVLPAQQPATPLEPIRPSTADTSPFRQLELPTPNAFRSASGMPGPLYWQQKADYVIRASL
ncbi:MAG TPA: hypothetical protein VFI13_10385, partial [Gemmatimonadales bacterium]|nr:hypothetical protein [Gemmatimonadales bacterium]